MSKVAVLLTERILPLVEELGYELVNIEYKREGNNWYLRIYIDAEAGITLEDCQKVSRMLNGPLDEWDVIPFAYFLEVSSPGLERPLKSSRDFKRFIGHKAKIKTRQAIDGHKTFIGEILSCEDDIIILKVDDNTVTITIQIVSSANLVS